MQVLERIRQYNVLVLCNHVAVAVVSGGQLPGKILSGQVEDLGNSKGQSI
jgi:hypothetical protein